MSSRRLVRSHSIALVLAGAIALGALPAWADSAPGAAGPSPTGASPAGPNPAGPNPAGPNPAGLSPVERTAIATAIAGAGAEGDPGQCPAPGALSLLAQAEPDHVAAIADFTARRLRAQDDVAGRKEGGTEAGGQARCACAAALTAALAGAAPEHATDVREAFDGSFPECDEKVTDAIETSLGGAPAGPGIPLDSRPDIPVYGPYGDPKPKCGAACTTAEPPAGHDASQTAL